MQQTTTTTETYDGVVFDVDGTLTRTNELIFKSFNYILDKYLGEQYTDEQITKLFGPPEEAIIEQFFPDNTSEVMTDYMEFYKGNHHLADLYAGIRGILDYIRSKGKPMGIFTGKGTQTAMATLEMLHVDEYFNTIVTGSHVEEHKPAPEGLLKISKEWNLPPEKILYVGDANVDVTAGREAGIHVISVLWDSYSKDKVLEMGSDYIAHSVEELDEIIRQKV